MNVVMIYLNMIASSSGGKMTAERGDGEIVSLSLSLSISEIQHESRRKGGLK